MTEVAGIRSDAAGRAADNNGSALEVDELSTQFFTRAGVVKAVNGVSFQVRPGEILGLVGESGSGKSMTGFSIMGLIDPPGRIVGGRILHGGTDLAGLDNEGLRQIRGNRIAMIFQDPMMTLNPVLRVDTQMVEAVLAHQEVDRARRSRCLVRRLSRSVFRRPSDVSKPTRTSFPAACASVLRSRLRS